MDRAEDTPHIEISDNALRYHSKVYKLSTIDQFDIMEFESWRPTPVSRELYVILGVVLMLLALVWSDISAESGLFILLIGAILLITSLWLTMHIFFKDHDELYFEYGLNLRLYTGDQDTLKIGTEEATQRTRDRLIEAFAKLIPSRPIPHPNKPYVLT
ncbi:MAG: hypothetical protein HWE20_13340 [Gammaproteobacteria bacterium]|nr:hypothetical protein [Gammaproteobacteria bacterium]